MNRKAEAAGSYPFTRGIYPQMYRQKLWTMRQYAGFGTAAETNRRFKELLAAGETGLSCAFDLPSQLGYDPDDEEARGEVGLAGVSISTYQDFKELFADIPLDKISVSFTINGTAPIILAMYLLLAREQGLSFSALKGTLQNDPLKEFTARGAWIIPPRAALQMATALNEFCLRNLPNFNPLSVSGYHIREAGASAAQEVAFALADGRCYLQALLEHGGDLAQIASRFSFFWAIGSDILTETAKLRAARRVWARMLHEVYQLSPDACKMRFHTQTAGSTLVAQDPQTNIVRVTMQTIAAVLGGTQSHHACSFDEALHLPSPEAARLSLITQQIIAAESGLTTAPDPLGGSYYLEELTDSLESEITAILTDIDNAGGALHALEYMAATIDGQKRPQYIGSDYSGPEVKLDMLALMRELQDGATLGQLAGRWRQKYGLYREPALLPDKADILLAKVGLDGHDRGIRQIFSQLSATGQKVAYSGRRHSAREIAAMARQLQVKKVGVSILSGAHNYHIPRLQAALAGSAIELEVGGLIG